LIYGSKITAASRGFPATARLSCLIPLGSRCNMSVFNSFSYDIRRNFNLLHKYTVYASMFV